MSSLYRLKKGDTVTLRDGQKLQVKAVDLNMGGNDFCVVSIGLSIYGGTDKVRSWGYIPSNGRINLGNRGLDIVRIDSMELERSTSKGLETFIKETK